METPLRQFARILGALEELSLEEEQILRSENYPALAALQQRAAPLVQHLTEYTGPTDDKLRARLAALVARRARGAELLGRKLELTRIELSRIEATQRRVTRVAPTYRDSGSSGGNRSRRLFALS